MSYITEDEEYEQKFADDLEALTELEFMHESEPSEVLNIFDNEYSTERNNGIEEQKNTLKSCIKRPNTDDLDSNSDKKRRKLQDHSELSTSSCMIALRKGTLTDNSDDISFETQSVTKYNGSRCYLKMYEDLDIQDITFKKNCRGFLQESIDDLKLQVFTKNEKSKRDAVTNISFDECADSELWVEKYRPQTFVELLSDEGINRTLLRWLKFWDKIVFGKEKQMKNRTKIEKKWNKPFSDLNENCDEFGRPMQKIVLLCGPPGLGKTTLANVIVRCAGYNAVELNASDDRSPDIFRNNLESSTQMKSVFSDANHPNCLIIDEIDGAPTPSINLLVSFVKSHGPTKGKKKKGDIPLLRRPIICICNDQYVSSLKPLRQIALILNFPPTSKYRLISRLTQVAFHEGLKSDSTSLTLLCEKVDNDIRACLSTMQFLYNLKKEFCLSDVKKLEIGVKDLHKSLFSIWKDIFYAPKSKLTKNVLNSVQGFGDYNKIFIGIFENYVKIKAKNVEMENICKGSDWLCFADIIQNEIFHSQVFSLLSYLPYICVAFHLLYASTLFQKLSYPSIYYESFSRKVQLYNSLTSVRNELITSLKSFFNSNCLVVDMLPMMTEVIKPSLRPVNTHLFSKQEKEELQRVIDVMIAFNLSYIQERTVAGEYRYVLEPNIEDIVYFSNVKRGKDLGYGAKQLIAREVDLEKMRRTQGIENAEIQGYSINSEKEEIPTTSKVDLEKRNMKTLKIQETSVSNKMKNTVIYKPNVDFFGRNIEISSKDNISVNTRKHFNTDVWYQFKEGHSNAVRRTVYIKDIL